MSLAARLAAQIRASGPMTVAEYMTACLHDPQAGYYATRPALGEGGDFITAPLVSQMFGELLGLWAVETWTRLGAPSRVRLVEMGPGDGTLMSDLLRAARLSPGFLAAAELTLVEVSPPLRAAQARALDDAALTPAWAFSLADLGPGPPVILVANELLDCLPAVQFVRTERGWAERLVGLDAKGRLAFGLGPPIPPPWSAAERGRGTTRSVVEGASERARSLGPPPPPASPVPLPRFAGEEMGLVYERSPAQEALGAELGALIARDGGAALLIDYGRDAPGFGDTLQALRRPEKVDPLACPGEADLTVHADFPAVAAAARAAGAEASAILTQAELLARIGVVQRAEALAAARPDQAEVIERQFHRLTAHDQMGALFKALCIHQPGLIPPGFEATP
jgi:NADH dehydrogenase [ubiquinone] 1 alpha subcomplex assembly factor 7